ncbi:MAG: hypothetical protein AAB766_01250 [Patescibacteria group bacterium]
MAITLRKKQARASPAPMNIDFSEGAVNKAILKKTVTSPTTMYPLAIGALGVFGCVLFGPAVPFLLAAIAGGAVGVGAWVVNFFIRGDALTSEHISDLRKLMAAESEQRRLHLRVELADCADIVGANEIIEQAISQFDNVTNSFNGLCDILEQKLNAGELTFGRFFGSANSVALSIFDNLRGIVINFESIRSIDVDFLERKISQLKRKKIFTDLETAELKTLEERSAIRERELNESRELLVKNEEAITVLEKSTAQIGDMKTGATYSSVDLETAMNDLKEIAGRSNKYDSRNRQTQQ